ncbi:MAG: primosomal protein N' [Gammaproteobacteria bacterium]|nr:primosomal protein N' [Gammaproteobacteria bacterium]
MNKRYLQVALPVPLRRHYDYVIGEPFNHVEFLPGMRVSVPFGRRKEQVGMALAVSDRTALRPGQLKSLGNVIDYEPLFSQRHFELLCWAADYYHYPVGEALFSALPALLRQGKGLSGQDGEALTASTESVIENRGFDLNPQQIQAIDAITANTDAHGAHLLQGVTGSGKTEVYIEVVRRVIAQDRQALILVPEIGLTTQFIDRLRQRLPVDIRVQHSALSETERLRNWLAAKNGTAPVIIGTRSAVWTPLKSPGIYVVDEEHDTSYKQDSGFRYSARDIAVVRGKFDSVPVVLGSATPSLETLKNVKTRKFSQQNLPARASGAASPEIRIINLRNETLSGAVSKTLLDEISATLDRNNQVLLFLNRRGYAPVILCHSCGWYAECSRCSAKMTFHKDKRCLMCHHCDSRRALPAECPDCNQNELIEVGHGTQRLDRTLAEHFPGANILRIDRDSTRRKGSMEKMIREITTGDADILIGTQMLAKGHHFPRLTLVGIIDADAGLLSTDFRASERMAQLIVQVSGRAGREDRPGAVYIQTHFPVHPLLQTLVTRGYAGFAGLLLSDRRNTHLPPYAYLALLGAEATSRETAEKFLREARDHLNDNNALNIFGPVAAPIEKRRGRYRSQLLIQSGNRNALRKVLAPWCRSLESMPGAKRTRWFLDIDPQDML